MKFTENNIRRGIFWRIIAFAAVVVVAASVTSIASIVYNKQNEISYDSRLLVILALVILITRLQQMAITRDFPDSRRCSA